MQLGEKQSDCENLVMNSVFVLAIVIIAATAFGTWHKISRGKIQGRSDSHLAFSTDELGTTLGEQATLVQFSSAFCQPCRSTSLILEQVVSKIPDVKHIEIDAESNLNLVRKLNILSTPTTIFLDRSGKEVARAVGAPKRDQVINALNQLQRT
jgi:thiol-disulfide isomerase/thioredoxin